MPQAPTILYLQVALPNAFSGVSVDSFLKKITFQYLTAKGLSHIGPTVEVLATAEGLQAHKNAITIRLTTSSEATN
jgi:histidinol dehydrogenase